jgi:hypothetical protein
MRCVGASARRGKEYRIRPVRLRMPENCSRWATVVRSGGIYGLGANRAAFSGGGPMRGTGGLTSFIDERGPRRQASTKSSSLPTSGGWAEQTLRTAGPRHRGREAIQAMETEMTAPCPFCGAFLGVAPGEAAFVARSAAISFPPLPRTPPVQPRSRLSRGEAEAACAKASEVPAGRAGPVEAAGPVKRRDGEGLRYGAQAGQP